ncbi:MAG: YdcF family protein [Oscillospiraceae bacterium]|nr:YdcF family protein [Oscillospiraceae bacterium]
MFLIKSMPVRFIGTAVFQILLILFLFPISLGILNLGTLLGSALSLMGTLYFACNPMIAKFLEKVWKTTAGHIVLGILLALMGFGAGLAAVISGCMLYTMYDAPKTEQPVVVLGCQVRNNGPSLMLKRRLDAAYTYLTEHPDVPVVVCGGQGPDEAMSEAQCMYEYLTKKGISPDRIYREDTSTSTFENLRNAKEILQEQNLGSNITIVTDGFHQLRADMIAKGLDLKSSHVSAYTSWYLVPTYWVREWLGVCYQFIFG